MNAEKNEILEAARLLIKAGIDLHGYNDEEGTPIPLKTAEAAEAYARMVKAEADLEQANEDYRKYIAVPEPGEEVERQ